MSLETGPQPGFNPEQDQAAQTETKDAVAASEGQPQPEAESTIETAEAPHGSEADLPDEENNTVEEQEDEADENSIFTSFLAYGKQAYAGDDRAEPFWDGLVHVADERKLFSEDQGEREEVLEEIHEWLKAESQTERYTLPDTIDDDLDQDRISELISRANKFYLAPIIDNEITVEEAQSRSHQWFVQYIESGAYLSEEAEYDDLDFSASASEDAAETSEGTGGYAEGGYTTSSYTPDAGPGPAHQSSIPSGGAKEVHRVGAAAGGGLAKAVQRVGAAASGGLAHSTPGIGFAPTTKPK